MTRHLTIHNKTSYQCNHCPKSYSRQERLKAHKLRHHKDENRLTSLNCRHCSKVFARMYTLKRHVRICAQKAVKVCNHDVASILSEMYSQESWFQSQLKLGGVVANLLHEHENLSEHSLSDEQKAALRLYRRSKIPHMCEFENATLKPWQEEVMSLIQTPSNREVIWIVGKWGKEGKTYLQDYIKYYYSERRVIATDVTGNKKNIAHFLSKCPLECKDIFLFNQACSSDENVAYDLLEGIKDGRILSHKYNTDQLLFKTPNTVIVFSNHHPRREALKKDRWRVYDIRNDQLYVANEKTHKKPIYFDKHIYA